MEQHHYFAARDQPAPKDHSPPKKKVKRTINIGSLFDAQPDDERSAQNLSGRKIARPSEKKVSKERQAYRRFAGKPVIICY